MANYGIDGSPSRRGRVLPDLLDLARDIGPFAREELVGIVDDDERFNDELRTVIRDSAAELLRELD